MSNQKELPSLSEDKGTKYERIVPEPFADAVGCQHDFVLKGYEVICTKCPMGLFVRNYQDYIDLCTRAKKKT